MVVILHHQIMLIALWVVLCAIALSIVVRILTNLRGTVNFAALAESVTRPLLMDVLPLLILSWLTRFDPTHVVVLVWYYVVAVLIILKVLSNLGSHSTKRSISSNWACGPTLRGRLFRADLAAAAWLD